MSISEEPHSISIACGKPHRHRERRVGKWRARDSRETAKEQLSAGDGIMLRLLEILIAHHATTPEKQAERELKDLRVDLFQAVRSGYYRARLAFIEEVRKKGIDVVSDQRRSRSEELREEP